MDLADLLLPREAIVLLDMKQFLVQEIMLREADFRKQIAATNWTVYANKWVVLHCSNDALIPAWAYMIVSAHLAGIAADVVCAPPEHAKEVFLYRAIDRMPVNDLEGKRVVVKGCGDAATDTPAFVYLAQRLAGVVKALNYGEPCSMVPVFKNV